MRAVPFNEGDVGERLHCFMCQRPGIEFYGLTPEGNEEWDILELSLGKPSNWLICEGRFKIIEERLGYKIIFSTTEEVMEMESSWIPPLEEKVYRTLRNNLDAINERKCPSCGYPLEESFDYMIDDKNWEKKMSLEALHSHAVIVIFRVL